MLQPMQYGPQGNKDKDRRLREAGRPDPLVTSNMGMGRQLRWGRSGQVVWGRSGLVFLKLVRNELRID